MAAVAVNNNPAERNADATVHIGQLDDRVTDDILWELMIQAGPVKHVYIPRDRITGKHHGYGFCEFQTELDAAYATKVLNMTTLFSKSIRLAQSSADRQPRDIGANLFVGNLAPNVDEKLLYDAFSAFGSLMEAPVVMRDMENESSKGYGFVKYSSFQAADSAIATMNGQYISNRPIVVQFAFKKDGDGKERHGSEAERKLAAAASDSKHASQDPATLLKPHSMFADRPPMLSQPSQYSVPAQNTLPGVAIPTAGPPTMPISAPYGQPLAMQTRPHQPPSYATPAYPQPAHAAVHAYGAHAMPAWQQGHHPRQLRHAEQGRLYPPAYQNPPAYYPPARPAPHAGDARAYGQAPRYAADPRHNYHAGYANRPAPAAPPPDARPEYQRRPAASNGARSAHQPQRPS